MEEKKEERIKKRERVKGKFLDKIVKEGCPNVDTA